MDMRSFEQQHSAQEAFARAGEAARDLARGFARNARNPAESDEDDEEFMSEEGRAMEVDPTVAEREDLHNAQQRQNHEDTVGLDFRHVSADAHSDDEEKEGGDNGSCASDFSETDERETLEKIQQQVESEQATHRRRRELVREYIDRKKFKTMGQRCFKMARFAGASTGTQGKGGSERDGFMDPGAQAQMLQQQLITNYIDTGTTAAANTTARAKVHIEKAVREKRSDIAPDAQLSAAELARATAYEVAMRRWLDASTDDRVILTRMKRRLGGQLEMFSKKTKRLRQVNGQVVSEPDRHNCRDYRETARLMLQCMSQSRLSAASAIATDAAGPGVPGRGNPNSRRG